MSGAKAGAPQKWVVTVKNNNYISDCGDSGRKKRKTLNSSEAKGECDCCCDDECDCCCDDECVLVNKKLKSLYPIYTSTDMSDLGVDFLPNVEEHELYNDHDTKIAKEFEEKKKVKLVPANDLTYKKSFSQSAPENDPFTSLPDEVVMRVLINLRKDSLISLSQTCRRFRRLCRDATLWKSINIGQRNLSTDDIGHILSLGVCVLRLNTANFASPMLSVEMTASMKGFISNVRYLDLSLASIAVKDLALLMSKMRHLKKLSLESVTVDSSVIAALKENHNLDTLNLAMAEGLDADCIDNLCKAFPRLESLNLSWTKLDDNAIIALCFNLTPLIRHLDISGAASEHLNMSLLALIRRCPNLETLNMSDCISLSDGTFKALLNTLTELRTLSVSRCYRLKERVLYEIGRLPKLECLSVARLFSDNEFKRYKALFPNVQINEMLSVVARPTVGTRRTSIWEQATTDRR